MDWSNERYVRLYTRDTVTWKRLRWEGQCVLMQLLRRVDRAGLLDLSGVRPQEAVEALTGLPPEVVVIGLQRCLDLEVFEVTDSQLVMPNFIEAQESPQSDKARQRTSRERRRDIARAEAVTKRDETVTPNSVTECDTRGAAKETSENHTDLPNGVEPGDTKCDSQSQNVTEPSRPVTSGHAVSHGVTLNQAVPSLLNNLNLGSSEPSFTKQKRKKKTNSGSEKFSTEAIEAFTLWQQLFDHLKAVLDAKRAKLLDKWVKLIGLDGVKSVIYGAYMDDWSRNHNHKLGWLFRDQEQVEVYLAKYEKAKTAGTLPNEQKKAAGYSTPDPLKGFKEKAERERREKEARANDPESS